MSSGSSSNNSNNSLAEAIAENAAGPKSVTVDGIVTTAHSLRDQIEADKYLAAKQSARSRRTPLRFCRTTPGGPA